MTHIVVSPPRSRQVRNRLAFEHQSENVAAMFQESSVNPGEIMPPGQQTEMPHCPVCVGEGEPHLVAEPWWTCRKCTLEYVSSLKLPETPESLFGAAYQGGRDVSGMADFAVRLRRRAVLVVNPRLWFWTPAFELTLGWLRRQIPNGTVLELGCGLGYMLHALRRNGFTAVGLDVAEPAVLVNRSDGFQVWHGALDGLPADWVDPDAVVAFFMLHHLEDPLSFLMAIRRRWPRSILAIAQYGPSNYDPIRSQPPRTLTRWNARSLKMALERVGYRAEVRTFAGIPTDPVALRATRSVFRRTLGLPVLYRILKAVDRVISGSVLRPLERADFVLLAFAEPL